MKRFLHRMTVFALMAGVVFGSLFGCSPKQKGTEEVTTKTVVEQTEKTEQIEETKETTEDFSISLKSNNSWENNGVFCAQFDGTIKNQSEALGRNWKVTITVPEGASLENGWNGTYSIEGTALEITPVDYNMEIGVGQEITFGFIIDTKEAFSPDKVILSIGDKSYSMNDSESENNTGEKKNTAIQNNSEKASDKEAEKKPVTNPAHGTPLENHGALAVKGTDIVDRNGEAFQLKGVSTHGINWFPEYVNQEAFSTLSNYGVNAIRLAMYTADYNGYCSGGNKEELEGLIDKGVNICSELGMYVIIDWHILNDNNPNQNKDAAKTFFDAMAKKYADYDNVLYEICNEPNGGTVWSDVKSYSEEIIPIIRKHDKDALIIVGTPNWSQDVDVASEDKIEGYDNIVYAVHFYASTHKQDIRSKVKKARENGLPVIVSECSICEASGNGSINYDEAESWMKLINEYNLSFFAWNLSNKDEQSSLLKSSIKRTGNFEEGDFSETGTWFLKQFGK